MPNNNVRIVPRRSRRRTQKSSPDQVIPRIGFSYNPGIQKAIGISRSQYVKLRYCQQVTLSPNSTSNAYIVYTANGIFQPNIGASAAIGASTAHQPMGYDQYASFYNDYVVLSSKISVSASPPNSTNPATAAGLLSVLLSDSATAITNPQNSIEQGRAIWKHFNSNTSSVPVKISHTFDAKKFWNVKDVKDNLTRLGAAYGSNPSEQAYFHLQYNCNDGSSSTTTGPYCWVIIDYFCLLSGPADLSSS